jgi:hypothetical protein
LVHDLDYVRVRMPPALGAVRLQVCGQTRRIETRIPLALEAWNQGVNTASCALNAG